MVHLANLFYDTLYFRSRVSDVLRIWDCWLKNAMELMFMAMQKWLYPAFDSIGVSRNRCIIARIFSNTNFLHIRLPNKRTLLLDTIVIFARVVR